MLHDSRQPFAKSWLRRMMLTTNFTKQKYIEYNNIHKTHLATLWRVCILREAVIFIIFSLLCLRGFYSTREHSNEQFSPWAKFIKVDPDGISDDLELDVITVHPMAVFILHQYVYLLVSLRVLVVCAPIERTIAGHAVSTRNWLWRLSGPIFSKDWQIHYSSSP